MPVRPLSSRQYTHRRGGVAAACTARSTRATPCGVFSWVGSTRHPRPADRAIAAGPANGRFGSPGRHFPHGRRNRPHCGPSRPWKRPPRPAPVGRRRPPPGGNRAFGQDQRALARPLDGRQRARRRACGPANNSSGWPAGRRQHAAVGLHGDLACGRLLRRGRPGRSSCRAPSHLQQRAGAAQRYPTNADAQRLVDAAAMVQPQDRSRAQVQRIAHVHAQGAERAAVDGRPPRRETRNRSVATARWARPGPRRPRRSGWVQAMADGAAAAAAAWNVQP